MPFNNIIKGENTPILNSIQLQGSILGIFNVHLSLNKKLHLRNTNFIREKMTLYMKVIGSYVACQGVEIKCILNNIKNY